MPPDIVKLDIEGAEFESLIGFGKYFSNIKFLFIEILNSSYAIKLANLFGKSHFTFIDIDDRNKKLKFIDSLTGSSHRKSLFLKRSTENKSNQLFTNWQSHLESRPSINSSN